MQAVRYIEQNPVRAGLAFRPEQYRWSSASAHVAARDDRLVRVGPMLEMVGEGRWREFLGEAISREGGELFRQHERTGRPLGDDGFVRRREAAVGRVLGRKKRGPKGPWKHRHQNQVWCPRNSPEFPPEFRKR